MKKAIVALLAFTVQAAPRDVGWTMHGGEDNIRQSIWLILGTAPGERLGRPDFGCGIYDLVFSTQSAATAARALHWKARKAVRIG